MERVQAPGELTALLAGRRSPSVFDPEHELSDRDVDRLLLAAGWAPSFGNTQPWRFVVARRGDRGHRLLIPLLSRGNAGWVPAASAVFVAAAVTDREHPDDKAPTGPYAYYDLGQAAAHVTVQAESMGLRVHQFAGFDREAFAAAAGLPAHLTVLTGIAVGRYGDPEGADEQTRLRDARPRSRRPVAELIVELPPG